VEDDIEFELDVDLWQLAASAPADFGILQLTTSNSESLTQLWREYAALSAAAISENKHKPSMWRAHDSSLGLWSTQAYLINKQVAKVFIDKVVTLDAMQQPLFRIRSPFDLWSCLKPPFYDMSACKLKKVARICICMLLSLRHTNTPILTQP
jgi:GR25 family glycosyltransferase involved in LPS biosynthesis